MRKILGLAAKARSGKDTAAALLMAHPEVATYALADPLKEGCKALFGLTETETWDDNAKEGVLSSWARSPRQLFQHVGTEWMRERDPLHWLKRADREINHPPVISSETAPASLESPLSSNITVTPNNPNCPFILATQAIFGLSDSQLKEAKHIEDKLWKATPEELVEQIKALALRDFPNFDAQYQAHVNPHNNTQNTKPHLKDENQLAKHLIRTTEKHIYKSKMNLNGKSLIIIKDIRFENEADYIRQLGGEIWHIIRPSAEAVNPHPSESGIAIKEGDLTIYNIGTLDEYEMAVNTAWQAIKPTL
ncbi:deoxynucleotide monophosphate kinase [Pseudomonas sp. O230]|uniref:deoxynucleotide monophosphate kinase family protein n=1 Tax=Pseudomonas sp. O230 TaxID=3159450 RepID=UPI00387B4826